MRPYLAVSLGSLTLGLLLTGCGAPTASRPPLGRPGGFRQASTMPAAEDLYGAASAEVQAVKDAWDAVGVDEPAALAILDVSPASFNFTVPVDGTDSGILTISNSGVQNFLVLPVGHRRQRHQ